ncbi:putative Lipoprotein [Candidatus Sulfobium mesophilum]|uniref:Putative Lipoprotein n=1 Tax=Candidatus Sulfobium mesophilum TaxID=2016548 RepID=A0A2U3QDM7_9BACT|nr:putative Lipoprotein [Candidatus Sulfobium mesophilum]
MKHRLTSKKTAAGGAYCQLRRLMPCLIFIAFATFICSCTRGASSDSGTKGVSSVSDAKTHEWAERVANEMVSKIRKGHPRIYITPERIIELKGQALTSKKYQFDLLIKRMTGVHAALFYALGEDKALGLPKTREEYGRIAAETLMSSIKGGGKVNLDELALIYDWAHGALTDSERKAFVSFCRSKIGTQLPVHDNKSHGYRAPPSPQGWLPILAMYGDGIDDPYAKKLLIQGIRDTLLDNIAMEQVAGKEGGFADGTGYYLLVGGTFHPFLALGIATGSDFFFEHEVLTKIPNFLIYSMLPFEIRRMGWKAGSIYFAMFHDNWTSTAADYGSPGNSFRSKLAITAAEFRRRGDERSAGLYAWLLQQMGGIYYMNGDVVGFVLMDWALKPKSPAEVGLSPVGALGWDEEKGRIDRDRFGKKAGIGWVSMRSSWDNPDATFAIFKTEPFRYHGHQHRDSLGFMIAKGEELAIAHAGNYMVWYEGGPLRSNDPGWAQMGNFFSRTISSNNLLIYNPSEKFDGFSNDGGQRAASYWDDKWGRTYNGTAEGNNRDLGGLIRFENGKDFVYAAADATRAYNSTSVATDGNPPKVKLVQREFVYLKSPKGDDDYFVILDRVDAVKPDFKKFWLLQLRAKPDFDGKHRVAVGSEEGGIHLSDDTSFAKVVQEKAELSSSFLLPKQGNRVVRRLGGWVTTRLKQSLRATDNGPLDIQVESTQGLPDHPVVIITAENPNPEKETFSQFSIWPKIIHADTRPAGRRVCYFCEGKTSSGKQPAKLLKCIRATRSAPGFDMPEGARVIQEFRHMGIEGADRDRDAERIDYPWGYGLGYNYGDGNQYGLWRIEVSPKKASNYDVFLNVLEPSMKGRGHLRAELIESESGNMYGAFLGSRAVLFSKGPEPLLKGSYRIAGSGKVSQLLCNLTPGKNYRIKQDGRQIATAKATRQGTTQFESQVSKNSSFEFAVVD